MEKRVETKQYGLSDYILLAVLFSFFGWALEMVIVRLQAGGWFERGFLKMPICPIYGLCVLCAYFLLGTPVEGRGLLKNTENKGVRTLVYLGFSFLIPSLAEIVTGWYFEERYHVKLWSYSGMQYNYRGYVCLPVSLCWMGLLFLAMRFAFPFFKNRIGKLPTTFKRGLALIISFAIILDTAVSFFKMTGAGMR